MNTINDIIKNFEILKGLSNEEIDLLVKGAKEKSFSAGEIIWKQSDTGNDTFLVVKGRVEIQVELASGDSKENIAVLKPGEIAGESVLLGKQRRSADVVAKDGVVALFWQKEKLIALFEANKSIGYFMMRNIAMGIVEKLEGTNQNLRNALRHPSASIL